MKHLMMPIDLRSDTVTRPTPAMAKKMMDAAVGDDVFGEDPSVNELEAKVAAFFGMETALFVPSGTMANQLAIAVHTRPGESVLVEQDAHCYLLEAGGASALSGVSFDQIPRDLRLADAAIEAAIKPHLFHMAPTTLMVVENTHNVGAGRVLAVADVQRAATTAKRLGLAVHGDYARVWNAAAALGVAERDLVLGFDTIAICFSKGLGAPTGSALVGPKALIDRARRLRKRWGGGMRQAGYLAAAAIYALDHHRERLKEDHAHAALFANRLRAVSAAGAPLEVMYPDPGTNMVYFRLRGTSPEDFRKKMQEKGVLMLTMPGGWLRAVTHLDVTRAEIERATEIVLALASAQ